MVVEESSRYDHNMKELVRVEPKVKTARVKAFRQTKCVDEATEGVRSAHDDQQQSWPVVLVKEALLALVHGFTTDPVDAGEKGREAVAEEESSSVWQIFAFSETV